MSGHVVVDDLAAGNRILRELHALLDERFDIDHTTIQLVDYGDPQKKGDP